MLCVLASFGCGIRCRSALRNTALRRLLVNWTTPPSHVTVHVPLFQDQRQGNTPVCCEHVRSVYRCAVARRPSSCAVPAWCALVSSYGCMRLWMMLCEPPRHTYPCTCTKQNVRRSCATFTSLPDSTCIFESSKAKARVFSGKLTRDVQAKENAKCEETTTWHGDTPGVRGSGRARLIANASTQ